ncbi:VOC family protein [Pseudoalteromonas aurantia]|uniref:Lactoylglutathione lyase n=1 Tax=Pseudoalteromonas aurantia 208 TaxID=1314867 RepID=A0ABR9EI77_9GAMM|nr:VOC family protein [Pseudoalteromonas aurantia]MBE0370705.1 lactoylglutathione lyase [Pseudoalteromonas aurantia 208]
MKTNLILIVLIGLNFFTGAVFAKSDPIAIGGVNHVGLTVSDLELSKAFFVDQLGFKVNGHDTTYPAYFLSNEHVMVTLWQVVAPLSMQPFNRKNNVGLHHLAFNVSSVAQLNALHERFKTLKNMKIEFAPELLGKGPTQHMMIREPSGNRIEFIVRSGK